MAKITEQEFARICREIKNDAELICRHNPIGTPEEILLWMLMCCLVSFLSLPEIETPCFSGKPNAKTYKDAIKYILANKKATPFDEEKYLGLLSFK